jgi:hypothetical protein
MVSSVLAQGLSLLPLLRRNQPRRQSLTSRLLLTPAPSNIGSKIRCELLVFIYRKLIDPVQGTRGAEGARRQRY